MMRSKTLTAIALMAAMGCGAAQSEERSRVTSERPPEVIVVKAERPDRAASPAITATDVTMPEIDFSNLGIVAPKLNADEFVVAPERIEFAAAGNNGEPKS